MPLIVRLSLVQNKSVSDDKTAMHIASDEMGLSLRPLVETHL